MSESIVVPFSFPGVEEGERATKMFDSLTATLRAGKGAGKSLTELRQILTGLKGGSSTLSDLTSSIKGLNTASAKLGTGINSSLSTMNATIKTEFQKLTATIKTQGFSTGQALGDSFGKGAKTSLDTSLTQVESQAIAKVKRISAAVKSAANMGAAVPQDIVGTYQRYNPKTQSAGAMVIPSVSASSMPQQRGGFSAIPKGEPARLASYSSGVKRLTGDMGDLHSAARGVASGFGMMWLTWGRLVPLLVGASISHSFMQTAKQGSEIAQTLATIEHVGGNTKREMDALTASLEHMGRTGIKGPMEVAEAMKTLSLAGLKAGQISSVMQDVSNFAVAGTTDMQVAAQTLVGVSTAFKLGSGSFGYVSDIISKAAAESMSSVESFAEAMKTASVVNSQYGVTLQDTAVGIAMLSQVNIQGTSAGTAIRNFYKDISERTPKVSKAMKKLGVDFRDNITGQMKDLPTIVKELDAALKGGTGRQEADILKNIASERGGKVLFEMLALFRQKANDLGTDIPNVFAKMYSEITEKSAGFSATTAAKMSQTVANQFSSLKSVIQTELFQVYKSVEPQLYLIIQNLKAAFSDPSVVGALKTLVSSIANLGLVISQNIEPIMRLVLALGALKVAQMVLIPLGGKLAGAMGAITAAMNTQNIAAKAGIATSGVTAAMRAKELLGLGQSAGVAKKAFDSMGMPIASAANTTSTFVKSASGATSALKWLGKGALAVGAFIPYLNIAIAGGTAAWVGYSWWANKSVDANKNAADAIKGNILGALDMQIARLSRVIALQEQGLTLTEAQARMSKSAETRAFIDEQFPKQEDPNKAESKQRAQALVAMRLEEKYGKAALDAAALRNSKNKSNIVVSGKNARYKPETAAAGPLLPGVDIPMQDITAWANTTKEVKNTISEITERQDTYNKLVNKSQTADAVIQKARTDATATSTKGLAGYGEEVQKQSKEGKRAADEAKRNAESYIESLQKMVEKTLNLTEAEKLSAKIKDGSLILVGDQLTKAKDLAAQADALNEKEQQRLITLQRQKDIYDVQMSALKGVQDMNIDQAAHGRGPKAASDIQKSMTNSYSKQNEDIQTYQTYKDTIAAIDAKAAGVRSAQDFLDADRAAKSRDIALAKTQEMYDINNNLHLADIERRKQNEADWQAGLLLGLESYSENASNLYGQMSEMAGGALKSMEDSLVNFVKTGTIDLRGMIAGVAGDIIGMLAKMAIQFFIVTPLMEYLKAAMGMEDQEASQASALAGAVAATAASFALGAAMAAAYAPAAALASLASFGANAVPANTAILTTVANAKAAAFTGFSDGGYTGAGGKYQPAGIVHRGEGVLNQSEISKLGGPAGFESLRSSIQAGNVNSGLNSSRAVAVPYNRATMGSSAVPVNNITVNVIEDASRAGQTETSQGLNSEEVISIFVSNIQRGGQAGQTIESTYGLDRRGR